MEHMCKVYEKLKGVEEHEKAKNELNVVIHTTTYYISSYDT